MKARSNSGLSLVELLVAMVAAAILVLTAGTMLATLYRGWVRNRALTDMGRDATGIRAFDMAVRGASATSNPDTGIDHLRVVVNTPAGMQTQSFSRVANSLFYNPSGVSGGMLLISNRLDARAGMSGFVSSITNGQVFLTVNLFDPASGVAMSISNMCFRLRN